MLRSARFGLTLVALTTAPSLPSADAQARAEAAIAAFDEVVTEAGFATDGEPTPMDDMNARIASAAGPCLAAMQNVGFANDTFDGELGGLRSPRYQATPDRVGGSDAVGEDDPVPNTIWTTVAVFDESGIAALASAIEQVDHEELADCTRTGLLAAWERRGLDDVQLSVAAKTLDATDASIILTTSISLTSNDGPDGGTIVFALVVDQDSVVISEFVAGRAEADTSVVIDALEATLTALRS